MSEEATSTALTFNTPDNESNIILDGEGQVKAASFSKLIERLTSAQSIGTTLLTLPFLVLTSPILS